MSFFFGLGLIDAVISVIMIMLYVDMLGNPQTVSPGSLVMADQVKNMVYRVMIEDWRRPERG